MMIVTCLMAKPTVRQEEEDARHLEVRHIEETDHLHHHEGPVHRHMKTTIRQGRGAVIAKMMGHGVVLHDDGREVQ